MTHEEKKVAKIVEELTVFFFAIGADDMESDIKRDGNQVTIFLSILKISIIMLRCLQTPIICRSMRTGSVLWRNI